MEDGTQAQLRLRILAEKSAYDPRNIRLGILFENVGPDSIKLLRHFQPVPVFFSIHMTRSDRTPVSIPGAGKISFQKDSIEYLQLNKNEMFGPLINIADLIHPIEEISEGDYELSVTYHNQYGEGCFRGKIKSNSINVKIADSTTTVESAG